jgi:hypothetical protein
MKIFTESWTLLNIEAAINFFLNVASSFTAESDIKTERKI